LDCFSGIFEKINQIRKQKNESKQYLPIKFVVFYKLRENKKIRKNKKTQ